MMVREPVSARPTGRLIGPLATAALCIAMTGLPALAQAASQPRHAAAATAIDKPPPSEPFPDNLEAKTGFAIGALHATITQLDPGAVLPAGGSGFVTVIITDPGGNKQVTLLAEAESGQVGSITGANSHTAPVQGGIAAEIQLPAVGPTQVTVELVLKAGRPGPDRKPRGRLRLTLLPQKGGRDEAVVAWPLADCAGQYGTALKAILEGRRERMLGTLDAVSAIEPDAPTTWLFPPPKPASPVASCKPQGGKRPVGCVAPKAMLAKGAGTVPEVEEVRIFKLAGEVMTQKGALPQFQHRTQPLRQASYTLLSSLRLYMEQAPHPALCSGVDDMVHYYQGRTGLLRSTIDESERALVGARTMAAARVAALTGSPSPQAASSATELIDMAAGAVVSPVDVADVTHETTVWSKLRRLRALLDSPATADLPSGRRVETVSALSMIEASRHLEIAAGKFHRLDEIIYGTLSAIAEAHGRACVCAP